MGGIKRAYDCYRVAASLSAEGTFVNISARAGEMALRIAQGEAGMNFVEMEDEISAIYDASRGMGGTLEAVAHVLKACITKEILTAKYAMT